MDRPRLAAAKATLDNTKCYGMPLNERTNRTQRRLNEANGNWKSGEDVIIIPAVSDDEAKEKFPGGWESPKPYIRIVPQPN